MKRIYLGALLVIGLVLAGCGNLAPGLGEKLVQPTKRDFKMDEGTLRVASAGEPIFLANFVGSNTSLGTATPLSDGFGGATAFMRHFNGFAQIDLYTPETAANPVFRQDSSWKVVKGLATDDQTCFSLESVNFPGRFLRHIGARVRLGADDGSGLFRADATWCTRKSLDGATDAGDLGRFSFESFSFPGRYMRRFNNQVWLAQPGGSRPSDNPTGFASDASWDTYIPLVN